MSRDRGKTFRAHSLFGTSALNTLNCGTLINHAEKLNTHGRIFPNGSHFRLRHMTL